MSFVEIHCGNNDPEADSVTVVFLVFSITSAAVFPEQTGGINRLLRHLLYLDRVHAKVIIELALERVTLGKHFL